MADRKPFLLRLDERTFLALRRWADDDLRSVNAQMEFLLRHALEGSGRLKRSPEANSAGEPSARPKPRR